MRAATRIGILFLGVGIATVGHAATFGQYGADSASYTSPTPFGETPCAFTQNLDPDTLESGVGVTCVGMQGSTDTQYLRVFDLDGDHHLQGDVCVEQLEYGVEDAHGGVELTFSVYCVPHGFGLRDVLPRDELDAGLVYSRKELQPDAELQIFDTPLGGCCNAQTHDMAIEIGSEDCNETGNCEWFTVGGNYGGAVNHWFIGAPDCGVVDPLNADLIIGFVWPPILLNVEATCSGSAVPALSAVGLAVATLLTAGLGAAALKRRNAFRAGN